MAPKHASRLAVTLYTLRDFCTSADDTPRTLARVRRIGYENVQVSGGGLMALEPSDLARMAADAGVRIIGSHIGLPMMREDFRGVVARLHAWGCPYTAIPYLAAEERATLADWKARAKEFTRLGRAFAGEGIALQYHNHHFEFQKFGGRGGLGGRTGLDLLYASSDPRYLQAEIDVGPGAGATRRPGAPA